MPEAKEGGRPRRLVGRVNARRFHRSFGDQSGELWSPDGRLLATSHQVVHLTGA